MKPKQPPKNFRLGCTVIIVIIIISFIVAITGDDNKFDPEDYSTKAKIISEEVVKASLKSPSSAKFPDECVTEKYFGDSIFLVHGCVDAQNTFGAMIRTNYRCKLQYLKDDWADINNWKIMDFNIEEN
jgi:hypothetical protein